MTAVDTNVFGADTWRATAFILDGYGNPLASTSTSTTTASSTAYEGIDIPGVQDWTPNFPKPRTIVGLAQGRVKDTLAMPPNTAMMGTLKSLYHSQTLELALQGTKIQTILDKSVLQKYTDRQGLEPSAMLMIQQLVTHGDDGNPVWWTVIFPHCRLIAEGAAFNTNASSITYNVVLSPSNKSSLGVPYTMATHGCLNSVYDDYISEGLLNLCFFRQSATATFTEFDLPISKQSTGAAATMGMYDFTTGVALTTGLTVSTTNYVFSPISGAANDILAAIYEMS